MYNPASLKAEEFIDHQEILDTLTYSEAHSHDRELICQIIEKAKESEVPVHEDSKLAETLSRLEIGDAIPPELYEVVAEILVFVDAMDKIKSKLK